MPEPTPEHVFRLNWRILVDVNADEDVDQFFLEAGAIVHSARKLFDRGAPDEEIDRYARDHGCIIVSHDRQFMKLIQRRLYQRDIEARSGYGRILLCGFEKRQAGRLREVLPVLVMYHQWATETDHRFMVSIGDNWVRFDDKPIARVIRGEPTPP